MPFLPILSIFSKLLELVASSRDSSGNDLRFLAGYIHGPGHGPHRSHLGRSREQRTFEDMSGRQAEGNFEILPSFSDNTRTEWLNYQRLCKEEQRLTHTQWGLRYGILFRGQRRLMLIHCRFRRERIWIVPIGTVAGLDAQSRLTGWRRDSKGEGLMKAT